MTVPRDGSVLSPVGHVRTRVRTSDRVYDELVTAIRELRIPPGAALSETDLAEQLQVSRTPLREAIARLVDVGLVSVVPQVGTRVERIRLRDVEVARFVRESLEVAVFEVACSVEAREVGPLRALLEHQEHCHRINDVAGFFAADEALHRTIFELGGYPGAWSVMQPLKLQLDRLRRLSLPSLDVIASLIDEHTRIVDALESGDRVGGVEVIRKHARRVMEDGPQLREAHPDLFSD